MEQVQIFKYLNHVPSLYLVTLISLPNNLPIPPLFFISFHKFSSSQILMQDLKSQKMHIFSKLSHAFPVLIKESPTPSLIFLNKWWGYFLYTYSLWETLTLQGLHPQYPSPPKLPCTQYTHTKNYPSTYFHFKRRGGGGRS